MSTLFPSNLDTSVTIPAEGATIPLSINHVTAHQNIQDSIEAIEAKVGADSSIVTTSHDYKLSGVTGSDKAVSKTGTETLTNKTLTSPVINVTNDATGDMYYRNAGVLTRIPVGTDNQIMKLNGTTPNWEAETTTVDASTTVKGLVEIATASEINAGTATGGTAAPIAITPDQLALSGYALYGGDGSDGALSIAAGTTTIDCANAPVVVKNYTSISITGTGNLAFSNPNTNGTVIILKSQGAVTMTSSSGQVIDLRNMGSSGGAVNTDGTTSYSNNILQSGGGVKGAVSAGAGGTVSLFLTQQDARVSRYAGLTIGAGGGGSATGATGAGGRGAGSLIIECNGAFNFTTGTISALGTIGTSGGAGIGGSGGSGSVYIYYKTLTANSGTISVTSTAGLGTGGGSFSAGGGGAGAASGGAGSGTTAGGAGGAGISQVVKYTLI